MLSLEALCRQFLSFCQQSWLLCLMVPVSAELTALLLFLYILWLASTCLCAAIHGQFHLAECT